MDKSSKTRGVEKACHRDNIFNAKEEICGYSKHSKDMSQVQQ